MYRLTNAPSTGKMSPKEAEKNLVFNTFAGQRAFNPLKARRYADLIVDGRARPFPIAFASSPSFAKVLVNGQHSLHAIALAGIDANVIIEHYKCDTDDDLWKLFATFDVHGVRTERQIMKGARGLFKDERLHEVPLRILQLCGSAMAILGAGDKPQFSGNVADKSIKPTLVQGHGDEVMFISQFVDFEHVLKVGCVAAMIATKRKEPKKSEDFWQLVADGIGFKSKACPAYKLREDLKHRRNFGHSGSTRVRMWYSLCVCWWNAWITGEKRHIVKLRAMKEVPSVLGQSSKNGATTDKLPSPNNRNRSVSVPSGRALEKAQ